MVDGVISRPFARMNASTSMMQIRGIRYKKAGGVLRDDSGTYAHTYGHSFDQLRCFKVGKPRPNHSSHRI
jgi:hypothetical protein